MAKLPALIETVGVFVHQDPSAIRYAARSLREAGLFSAGSGGRGSPHMTSRDAIYLMLALTVATEPSQYVSTVRALADLERSSRVEIPEWTRPGFEAVCSADNFGDALVALLDGADGLAILDPVNQTFERPPGQVGNRRVVVTVSVTRKAGNLLGRVHLEDLAPGASSLPNDTRFGNEGEAGDYLTWTGVTSVQIFDPAPFIALKRTLAPTPPWVFQA